MYKMRRTKLLISAFIGSIFIIGTSLSFACTPPGGPCQCAGWSSVYVFWTGSGSGTQITSCGAADPVYIGWIDSNNNEVKIISLPLCSNCQGTYSWSVTKTSGLPEVPWNGNTLPIRFAPTSPGRFEVVQNFICAGTTCTPCNNTIQIDNVMTPLPHRTQQEIETACDLGIAWLAAQQNLDGSWGDHYTVGETGLALLKLEGRAFEPPYSSPFDTDYPYYQNIMDGLNYLFNNAVVITRNSSPYFQQPWGDPDTDGDHRVIYFLSPSTVADTDPPKTYETSISIMAIAASRYPNGTASGNVNGLTYQEVVQDAVDYLAWSQVNGGGPGGWRYTEATVSADNSCSGYVVGGLQYAENAFYGVNNVTIPSFVKNYLGNTNPNWIDYIQDADGGSGYYYSYHWKNTLKTGNLLSEMAFVGDSPTTTRVQNALSYIGAHWYNPNLQPGWGWNQPVAYYQATYCLMKGLQSMDVPLNGIKDLSGNILVTDWYQDLVDVIVPQQTADGSWPQTYQDYGSGWGERQADSILSTEWALLTLEKTTPPPPPQCAENCTCVDDSIAVGCNFIPCDNPPYCSDNITLHCYTCPYGCKCRPEAGSENLTECAPNCPNLCPSGQKCYGPPCGCGFDPVTVSWSGSPPGSQNVPCNGWLTGLGVNAGSKIMINSPLNCSGYCQGNWGGSIGYEIFRDSDNSIVKQGRIPDTEPIASFTTNDINNLPGNYTVLLVKACGPYRCVCFIHIQISGIN